MQLPGTVNDSTLAIIVTRSLPTSNQLILEKDGDLQGLQIFMRPSSGGLEPMVPFYDFPTVPQPRRLAKPAVLVFPREIGFLAEAFVV